MAVHLDGGVDGASHGVAPGSAVPLLLRVQQLPLAPQHGADETVPLCLLPLLILPSPHLRRIPEHLSLDVTPLSINNFLIVPLV